MMNKKGVIFLNEISKLNSNEQRWNPYTWYKEMRENNPVFFDEGQKVWNVFRYDDVKRVLSDFEHFSSERDRSLIPIPTNNGGINLLFSDPPEHRNRRGLLAKAFTPRNLESWRPRIQSVVDMLIEKITEEDTSKPLDIVKNFAAPLPVTIIADLLGVPNKDWSTIKEWSDILFLPHYEKGIEELTKLKNETMQTFANYLLPLVKHKRNHPQDDILSDLTQVEFEGKRLTDMQVVYTGIGLLGAGNETTTTLLTLFFYSLIEEEKYTEIKKNPELIPKAMEEVLRHRFIINLDRMVKKDTPILGTPMKKGDMIVAWIASANRDQRHFKNPEVFDINRSNNRNHLTFGNGHHSCLGSQLARLETEIAMTTFINRFSEIHFAPNFQPENNLIPHGSKLAYLPITIKL
ncbi:cytochrome P450 [Bacillus thuringiensis]|uniref:cytochrome P450 n=1 Tax=Bacillus thuringiensis TaxID=1428 RepID=UPI000CFA56CD|nr:cytochrome P450 [Bacillus thuringiensis]PQQ47583.1 cytochrome P450 [Bacillus thuringiensis]